MISNLDGITIRGYQIYVGEEKQLKLSGWKGIKLFLKDPHGNLAQKAVVEGIYSRGGGNNIKPWMDLNYRDEVTLKNMGKSGHEAVNLSREGLAEDLFHHMSSIIPPGGHLMVSYEGSDLIHTDTLRSLYLGVPPPATPLGFLLFSSGFLYVKDWYLAEGGHEGPRKLWGEKSFDLEGGKIYSQKTEKAIRQFLGKNIETKHHTLFENAKMRAMKILENIGNTT